MFFYLHFILLTSGLSGAGVLLGVFLRTYSDASQQEIGILLMSFPFVSIIVQPLVCSIADRRQSHRLYLILALLTMLIGYAPFVIIPYCTHFYTHYPRLSWYALVVACHVGNGGLGVAWSLGDSLAVNMAQKTNTPYGIIRMGTVSWGINGFLVGQINEISYFPKYVPTFLILHISVLVEIIMILFWNKEDFVMCDPASDDPKKTLNSMGKITIDYTTQAVSVVETKKGKDKNPQVFIFKMIFSQDGRLVKYLTLFVMFGILLAPINFVFLSLVEVCKERDYNFSQLAGAVLISQAIMETVSFFSLPRIMPRVSRTLIIALAWTIIATRYYFYAYYFYTSDISPYWTIVTEGSLGISYGIFITNLADLSLMFACESELFIPELRKMGYLSTIYEHANHERVKEEENLIRMALRATMQGMFSGAVDGLEMGLGALICGMVAESYSCITLWKCLLIVCITTALIHQLIELSRCRLSDIYKPKEGTKAHEIMVLSSQHSIKGQ